MTQFRRASELAPDNPLVLYNLGGALMEDNRLEDAAAFGHALAVHPGFADAHNTLGLAFQGLGRLEDAVASYRKALVIKPDFPGALNNLGISLLELGRIADAAESYRNAITIDSENDIFWAG